MNGPCTDEPKQKKLKVAKEGKTATAEPSLAERLAEAASAAERAEQELKLTMGTPNAGSFQTVLTQALHSNVSGHAACCFFGSHLVPLDVL